jgi:hypothetical protein
VLVEHGGHGGDVAAPLAMEIVNNTFETVLPADREAPRLGPPAPPRAAGAGSGGRDSGAGRDSGGRRDSGAGRVSGAARASGAARRASRGGDAMNVVKAVGWRKLRFRFDWTLTLSALTVAALGLVNLWSAVHDRQAQPVRRSQVSWLGLGVGVFVGVATLDYRLISRLSYIFYGAGVALLHGRARSSARWWAAGGAGSTWARSTSSRPSSMQVLTVLALGKYLNDSPALEGRSWRHLAMPVAHRQRAASADRQAARLRHGVPAAAIFFTSC